VLGLADEPFTYDVQIVRDGKNYCVRKVDVTQEDEGVIVFTALCSFKKTEENFLNIQVPKIMEKKWSHLLKGKTAETLPMPTTNYKDLRYVLKKLRCE
jgi:acyl-CoA thioesterase